MNEPYILGALKRHLNPAHPFGVINESVPIVKSLTGISPEEKENYLKRNRDIFLNDLKSGSGEEVAFQIEAALDMLTYFWQDASEIYNDSNDGVGMDSVTWSLVKSYYFETINYTAQLYRLHLLHPTDELYNIEQKFKGLTLAQVHQVIVESGLLTLKRMTQLELKAEKASARRLSSEEDADIIDRQTTYGTKEVSTTLHTAEDSKDLSSSPSEEASSKYEVQPPAIIISDRMKEYLDKAKDYIKGGHWWNNNKKQYAIFLKVLYCKVFHKEWSNYVRWIDLPLYPLRDGTQLSIPQIKGALRGYDATKDGGVRKSFEKIFDKV